MKCIHECKGFRVSVDHYRNENGMCGERLLHDLKVAHDEAKMRGHAMERVMSSDDGPEHALDMGVRHDGFNILLTGW